MVRRRRGPGRGCPPTPRARCCSDGSSTSNGAIASEIGIGRRSRPAPPQEDSCRGQGGQHRRPRPTGVSRQGSGAAVRTRLTQRPRELAAVEPVGSSGERRRCRRFSRRFQLPRFQRHGDAARSTRTARRRIGAELRAHQLPVGLSAAQRFRALAGMVQRRHQAERGVGAQRVELEEPSPPVRRHSVLAPCGRFGRQHLQRSPVLARQPGPLGLRPGLEFPAPIQVKAVEKRRGVARDRLGSNRAPPARWRRIRRRSRSRRD